MGVHTYSIDDKIHEAFDEATPERKTSDKLEQLMEEYAEKHGEEIETSDDNNRELIYDKDVLTQKQVKLLDIVFKKCLVDIPKKEFVKEVKDTGLYSRTHFIKEALQLFSRKDDIPITTSRNRVEPGEASCTCSEPLTISGKAFCKIDEREKQCSNCGTILQW